MFLIKNLKLKIWEGSYCKIELRPEYGVYETSFKTNVYNRQYVEINDSRPETTLLILDL